MMPEASAGTEAAVVDVVGIPVSRIVIVVLEPASTVFIAVLEAVSVPQAAAIKEMRMSNVVRPMVTRTE
jgi:hypothetical protein